MEQFYGVNTDRASRQPVAGFSAGTLAKSAAYKVTPADIMNAGGNLIVRCTVAGGAFDVTLPAAYLVKGAFITILKGTLSTNGLGAKPPATDQIDAGTAGVALTDSTSEFGAITLWAHDGSTAAAGIWRVVSKVGTWA